MSDSETLQQISNQLTELTNCFYDLLNNGSKPWFQKTSFLSLPLAVTPNVGVPIGEGACRAVRLHLNVFSRNDVTLIGDTYYCYYGDSQRQECQLVATGATGGLPSVPSIIDHWSPLIYCTNLSQVFYRMGIEIDADAYLDVMVHI